MIQVNELRIGNLVKSNNILYRKDEFGKSMSILGMNDESATVTVLENGKPIGYTFGQFFKYLEPIELTEEILLKIGFTENENGEPQIDTFEGMALSISIKETPYKYTAWHVITTEYKYYMFAACKYLHQLQNLYFAITGNELSVSKI